MSLNKESPFYRLLLELAEKGIGRDGMPDEMVAAVEAVKNPELLAPEELNKILDTARRRFCDDISVDLTKQLSKAIQMVARAGSLVGSRPMLFEVLRREEDKDKSGFHPTVLGAIVCGDMSEDDIRMLKDYLMSVHRDATTGPGKKSYTHVSRDDFKNPKGEES